MEHAPHSIKTVSPPFCIMDADGKIIETFYALTSEIQPLLTKPGHIICIKYDITWFRVPTEFDTIHNKTKRVIFNVNTEEIRIVSKFKSAENDSESFVYKKESETEGDDIIPDNILALAKAYILKTSPTQLKRLIF